MLQDLYGYDIEIIAKQSISGGSISSAFKLTLNNSINLFLKENVVSFLPNFKAEAEGLKLLSNANSGPNVPNLIGVGSSNTKSFLLLEWLDCKININNSNNLFGQKLATLHRYNREEYCGLETDNFIGASIQKNNKRSNWIDFFRNIRLEYQFKMAIDSKLIENKYVLKIDHFLEKLESYLLNPEGNKTSLLHGDLWSGNVILGMDGTFNLIDPSVYYGHRECDIAMTKLFSGFNSSFYNSYYETWPLENGYEERFEIYNLYHLLNHLNLFGSSYYGSVMGILNRYC